MTGRTSTGSRASLSRPLRSAVVCGSTQNATSVSAASTQVAAWSRPAHISWVSISAEPPTRCLRSSPVMAASWTEPAASATTTSATHREAQRQRGTRRVRTARTASGTNTTAACTTRGWSGTPLIVMGRRLPCTPCRNMTVGAVVGSLAAERQRRAVRLDDETRAARPAQPGEGVGAEGEGGGGVDVGPGQVARRRR